jgi:hypothetical protein
MKLASYFFIFIILAYSASAISFTAKANIDQQWRYGVYNVTNLTAQRINGLNTSENPLSCRLAGQNVFMDAMSWLNGTAFCNSLNESAINLSKINFNIINISSSGTYFNRTNLLIDSVSSSTATPSVIGFTTCTSNRGCQILIGSAGTTNAISRADGGDLRISASNTLTLAGRQTAIRGDSYDALYSVLVRSDTNTLPQLTVKWNGSAQVAPLLHLVNSTDGHLFSVMKDGSLNFSASAGFIFRNLSVTNGCSGYKTLVNKSSVVTTTCATIGYAVTAELQNCNGCGNVYPQKNASYYFNLSSSAVGDNSTVFWQVVRLG